VNLVDRVAPVDTPPGLVAAEIAKPVRVITYWLALLLIRITKRGADGKICSNGRLYVARLPITGGISLACGR
jgi:hypothetical protein